MKKTAANLFHSIGLCCWLGVAAMNAHAHGGLALQESVPQDFDHMLVFASSRPYTPAADGTFFVDGLFGGDGIDFQQSVLGFTLDEIAQREQQAADFFTERFGIDVTDPRVYFTGFEVIPGNYDVVMSAAHHVPAEGWPIAEGGWIVVVLDPEGIELGGEFAGVHVPANSMMVKGTYYIERSSTKPGLSPEPMIMDYQSVKPMIINADGSFAFDCELSHAQWGEGLGVGSNLPVLLSDGTLTSNTRNVVTFPPFGFTAGAVEGGE